MSHASSPPPPAGLPATRDAAAGPPAVQDLAGRESALREPVRGTRVAARPPTIGEYLRLKHYRIDGWTPVRVAAFIEVLGETGSVTRAAAYVSMTAAWRTGCAIGPGPNPSPRRGGRRSARATKGG